MFDDVSMRWNDAIEVPLQHPLERAPKSRTIGHPELANQSARPEALPHAVGPKEHARDPGGGAMDVKAQVAEYQCARRSMEENHLVEAKAEHEKALDFTRPPVGWLIRKRRVEGECPSAPRRARCSQEPSSRIALSNLTGESAVRLRNHDESDRAKSLEFLPESGRKRNRRMEDELSVP